MLALVTAIGDMKFRLLGWRASWLATAGWLAGWVLAVLSDHVGFLGVWCGQVALQRLQIQFLLNAVLGRNSCEIRPEF